MESSGERTQTELYIQNHTNLLPYLANWSLYTMENGFWGITNAKVAFAQVFSASIVWMSLNLPEQAPTKTRQRVLLINLCSLYLLSTLYVTHVIN